MAEDLDLERIDRKIVLELTQSKNTYIRHMAQYIINQQEGDSTKKENNMETEISIPDRILLLRGIEIFEALSVSELAAVASVTEEIICRPGDMVIKEGETGENMYLVIKGEVSVIKNQGKKMKSNLIGSVPVITLAKWPFLKTYFDQQQSVQSKNHIS